MRGWGSLFGLLLLPRWILWLLFAAYFAAAAWALYLNQVWVGAGMVVIGVIALNIAMKFHRMRSAVSAAAGRLISFARGLLDRFRGS